eukprot:5582320-Amphidinium_carterae.2
MGISPCLLCTAKGPSGVPRPQPLHVSKPGSDAKVPGSHKEQFTMPSLLNLPANCKLPLHKTWVSSLMELRGTWDAQGVYAQYAHGQQARNHFY